MRMAEVDFSGVAELSQMIRRMEQNVDARAPAALAAAAQIALREMAASVPVRTGGLSRHLKISAPQHNETDGYYVTIGPVGKNERGQRYGEIGGILEHGRSNMPARPWMRPSVERCTAEAIEAMRKEMAER